MTGFSARKEMGDIVINTLTIEQYLALTRRDILGVVIPELGNDVDFEIKSQFMSKLRCKLFAGSISTWDLLEEAFIRKYCPPLKTLKKLEEIRNFKQGVDETLYQAWERYDDLQFKCPQHDLNNHQKVQIFYKGLGIPSRKMVDSQGLIPMMPPSQALKSIQIMADYSQNWYNEATTWQGSSNNLNDIVLITKRVDNLGCNMQKLQENIHVIQVGCKICKEEHLTKERPLKEDGKVGEQVKYIGFLKETINKFIEESIKKQAAFDEWIRKFRDDTDLSLRMLDAATKNLHGKAEQLTQEILINSMVDNANSKMRNDIEVKKEPDPFDLPNVNPYVEPTVPHVPFLGHLKEQEDEAQAFRTLEGLKKLKINRTLIRAVKRMPEYLMETHEEELELLLASDPQSSFTKIQVDRDITSPEWFSPQGDRIRGLLNSFYVSDAMQANDEVACDNGCCSRKQT
ncbi:lon protease 2, peroxisomal [Tanacetum coccineum]